MDSYGGGDDAAGYDGYEPNTVDPGPSVLVATALVCCLLYALLPCLVKLKRSKIDNNNNISGVDANLTKQESSEDAIDRAANYLGQDDCGAVALSDHDETSASASRMTSGEGRDEYEDARSVHSSISSSCRSAPVLAYMAHDRHYGHRRAQIEQHLRMLETTPSAMSNVGEGQRGLVLPLAMAASTDGIGDAASMLGTLDPDDVSFCDAVDAKDEDEGFVRPVPEADKSSTSDNDPRVGHDEAWCWGSWYELLNIVEWDLETRRIMRLSVPFTIDAFVRGAAGIGHTALIGQFIGTSALSAFIMVETLVGLTSDCIGGLQASLITLCSHSIGAGNDKLTGQYLQIVVLLNIACSIPFGILWIVVMEDAVKWFGFDEETAQIAHKFTPFFVVYYLLYGMVYSLDGLMDVTNRAKISTAIAAGFEVCVTATLALWTSLGTATLNTVGYIYAFGELVFLLLYIALVAYKGWFRPYYGGLVYSFALGNGPAVKKVLSTSAALCLGYLLTYGEWEILIVFASFLGPAEVAAWGLLGTIWSALEGVTQSIGNASEVRCAYLLGAGQPSVAKMSAYKSIFLGFTLAMILTSILFIASDNLATWLTTDATLQRLVTDLFPVFGLGNIALSMGSMAWTLVGSQGRYQVATAVGFAGSWFITLPLAAVFSAWLRVELQGQTAAIVIGYTVSGTVNTYLLLTSDWNRLSAIVVRFNQKRAPNVPSVGDAEQTDLRAVSAPAILEETA